MKLDRNIAELLKKSNESFVSDSDLSDIDKEQFKKDFDEASSQEQDLLHQLEIQELELSRIKLETSFQKKGDQVKMVKGLDKSQKHAKLSHMVLEGNEKIAQLEQILTQTKQSVLCLETEQKMTKIKLLEF